MGLDVGKRRIGLAVSDPLGLLARPLETVMSESLNRDVARISAIAHLHEAEVIVVGDPLHMNGDAGKMSTRAHRFGDLLAQVSGMPVTYCDERLTTV
ncbi:MAG: Holliday junction resolvase RuvX, partial [Chloroflexota bacterium]|nr:Holliday junction resolvase RuvX [Chloroflexota bacterium]